MAPSARPRSWRLSERLRFESLLAELAARLIPVSLVDVDVEIERGLARVAECLGVDWATLYQYGAGGLEARIRWTADGIAPGAPALGPERLPWTTARLERGHTVACSALEELPEEADRQECQSAGVRSFLAVPLRRGPPVLGMVLFGAVRGEPRWPEALVKRLRVLGDIFAGALERKRFELSLAERLRFETLLSEQAATFGSVSAPDVDREIRRALGRLADFFEADRGGLMEFSRDTRVARITHSWVAEGASPAPSMVSLAAIPWVMGQLHCGNVVRFSRLEDLPEVAAAVDRQTYRSLGIKSHVELPLKIEGTLLGSLAFSTLGAERVWAEDLVHRLQLLGEVFANVLSRRQLEVEAQRLRRDLSHVGRVSTIGELTASLAHQLNQPLTAILSNAQVAQELLASDTVNVAELRDIVADIVADDKRAADVIQRLRRLLKKDSADFTALDVNELVAEVARLVSGDAALRGVDIRLELAPRLPAVRGDRVQIQQVVLNLVLNGLDAIRESTNAARALALWTAAESGAVRVGVCDSGTGIEGEDADQIFEAFYTTKAEGLGMGLAIARSIVEAHGGRLTARNNDDAGATLSFTLPVTEANR